MNSFTMTPVPEFNPGSKRVDLSLNPKTHTFLMNLCENPPYFNVDHVFWIANLPYDALIPYIKAVYEAIYKVGFRVFIPIDNWQRAVREYKIKEKSEKCR